MTVQKDLHPRDDVDRLYITKREEGRLTSTEDCVDAAIQVLKKYTKKNKNKNSKKQSKTKQNKTKNLSHRKKINKQTKKQK